MLTNTELVSVNIENIAQQLAPCRAIFHPPYTNSMYSEDLAKRYTQNRDEYTSTDKDSLGALEQVGLAHKDVLDLGCGDGRYTRPFSFFKKY